jgi:hypothetical protein
MQAVTVALNRETAGRREAARRRVGWSQLTEAPLSWLTRLFGCWHQEMSRPFTLGGGSYRVCLECGAHRRFNLQVWEMIGPFYYETPGATTELYQGMAAQVKTTKVRAATPQRTQPRSLRAAA